MRLIDADALIEHLRKDPLFCMVERYGIEGVIENAPTIEPRNIIACPEVDELDMLERMYAEQTVIRSKTLMPTKDFKEWAKRIREVNPNAVVIPCDAAVVCLKREDGKNEID